MVYISLLAGFVILLGGAEILVRGASRLAIKFGISPMVVGLTVVAFGTSAPEGAISVNAALKGSTDLALGNVIGSNQFNSLAALGISGLVAVLVVSQKLVRREMFLIIGATLGVWLMALDGKIGRLEGAILFGGLLFYTVWAIRTEKKVGEPPEVQKQYEKEYSKTGSLPLNLALVLGGFAALLFGSRMLVESASQIAASLGMSELLVGLTVVAVGTSLPELATSLVAAFRGERDIAVGNVVGSSIFNILGVLGLTALIADVPAGPDITGFQLPALLVVSILMAGIFYTRLAVHRWEAACLVVMYVLFVSYSVLEATQNRLLTPVTYLGAVFVVATSLAVIVTVKREWAKNKELKNSTPDT